eukprot:gene21364-25678_t
MDEEGRKAEELKFEESLAPVPDQKTLVLVNTFIIQTAGLLNRFSALCERKLEAVNRYCFAEFVTEPPLARPILHISGTR